MSQCSSSIIPMDGSAFDLVRVNDRDQTVWWDRNRPEEALRWCGDCFCGQHRVLSSLLHTHLDSYIPIYASLGLFSDQELPLTVTMYPDIYGLLQNDNTLCHTFWIVQTWFRELSHTFFVLPANFSRNESSQIFLGSQYLAVDTSASLLY